MSSDVTGTNSERIDKLIVTVVELRTTLRICLADIGIGFPMMVGLLTFLVVQSFGTTAKIDRLNDQIAAVRGDYARVSERLDRLERPAPP
jgi:tetrahydromethanopterin S-methyltransferase subunit G